MKIKLLKYTSCVLALLFCVTFASQIVYLQATAREFLFNLASMPREQANAVVKKMVLTELAKGRVDLPPNIEQTVLDRLDYYLATYGEGHIIDPIYSNYKPYIPIRREIGIPISYMTLIALAILFLKEPRSPEVL